MVPFVVVVGYLPYASAGARLFEALLYYREKWRFNGFLFMQLSEQLKDDRQVEQLMVLIVGVVIGICLYLQTGLAGASVLDDCDPFCYVPQPCSPGI